MDALIALNRRELEIQISQDELTTRLRNLQMEMEKIRVQKADMLAEPVITPVKAKSAPAPAAPKKAHVKVVVSPTAAVNRKIDMGRRGSESSAASSVESSDSVSKHWKAFKKAKAASISAQQQLLAEDQRWGTARIRTAIRNAYRLDHATEAAALDQLEKARDASKVPRAPSKWLQYVAAVREELGCSHKDAMTEAGRRQRASNAL